MKYIKKLNIDFDNWDEIYYTTNINFKNIDPDENLHNVLKEFQIGDKILITDKRYGKKNSATIMRILKKDILLKIHKNNINGHNGTSYQNTSIKKCNRQCWWFSIDPEQNHYNLIIHKKI